MFIMNQIKNQISNGVKPKLIIFDFWNTLVYSQKSDPQKFYSNLGRFGIEIKNKEDANRISSSFSKLMCFSKNWLDFSQQFLSKFGNGQKEKNISAFENFLKENVTYKIYDDVKEISDLPYEKAILTDSARFLVEDSGFGSFGKIFTPQETGALKPDPKVFLAVTNEFKIKPEEAVMVGDDIERDLNTAQKLGMKTVLIDRENKSSNYLGTKINSLNELKNIMKGL